MARAATERLTGWISRSGVRLHAAAIVVAAVLLSIEAPVAVSLYGIPAAIALGVSALHVAAIVLAIRMPVVAASIAVVAGVAMQLFGTDSGPWPWPWAVTPLIVHLLVIGVLASRGRWLLGVGVLVIGAGAGVAVALLVRGDRFDGGTLANLIVFTSLALGAVVAGIVIERLRGAREQLAVEREVSAEEHAARVIAEEKARIARELHDVIAHSMSIINVQALSAPVRHEGVSEAVRQEFASIAAEARRGLADMRVMLGVLRDERVDPQLAPQPRIADVTELVEQARNAGATVELHVDADLADVPALTQLAAFRIVQEALSNAMRHAPGAAIDVTVARASDAVRIRVRDGGGSPAAVATGGHGIMGMRERAAGLGGTLETTPTADGFVVEATLPFERPDDDREERA